jgi:hypothetical protein
MRIPKVQIPGLLEDDNEFEVQEQRSPEPAIFLAVYEGDPRILFAKIDRTAPQTNIIGDLKRELPLFGVPYRSVDPRIFEAVLLKRTKRHLTYREVSEQVFGRPREAESIRYWLNKWSGR